MSLRLWRVPQPYFKLRFCSLIAFGPDCSHFPSAIPNMRETAPTSSAPSAKPAGPKPTSTSTPCPTPLRSPRSALGAAAAAATGSASRPGRMAHARRRACQTIARNARMRADQRALGFAQPGRKYNKGWCWRVPTCALAETSKRLARKSRTKAMTPAHKQAMTKTLLGLIAAFGVWLAPPEPPRPLLARQRDEHSSLARNYPGSIVARLLGLNRRPSVRAAGVAPTISRG